MLIILFKLRAPDGFLRSQCTLKVGVKARNRWERCRWVLSTAEYSALHSKFHLSSTLLCTMKFIFWREMPLKDRSKILTLYNITQTNTLFSPSWMSIKPKSVEACITDQRGHKILVNNIKYIQMSHKIHNYLKSINTNSFPQK